MIWLALLTGAGLSTALAARFCRRRFGLPFWALSFFKKRREGKFLDA